MIEVFPLYVSFAAYLNKNISEHNVSPMEIGCKR